MNDKIIENIESIVEVIPNAVIIPIKHNDKKPMMTWKNIIKTDIRAFNKLNNYGVLTGSKTKISVVDIDTKDKGIETYNELIKRNGEVKTLKSKTPHDGIHLIFNYNECLNTTTKVGNVGIDIRNDGALILCQPSIIDNKRYEFDTTYNISDIPE
jgi:hypothetical protein